MPKIQISKDVNDAAPVEKPAQTTKPTGEGSK